MRGSLLLRLLLLLAALLLIPACGHKGPVKPLPKTLPEAVQKLRVKQAGDSLVIFWAAPASNQDGSLLLDLDHYDVYRMSYNPADDCPECRDTSSLLRSVDPGYLKDVQHIDNRFYLTDRLDLEANRGYQYRVVAINRDGHAGFPAEVRKPYYLSPTPPAELVATGLDKLVRLAWKQPAIPDGMTLTGYRIYRGTAAEPMSPIPLNSKPVTDTGYDDFAITNGINYRYGVRAVFVHNKTDLETKFSNLVRATPAE